MTLTLQDNSAPKMPRSGQNRNSRYLGLGEAVIPSAKPAAAPPRATARPQASAMSAQPLAQPAAQPSSQSTAHASALPFRTPPRAGRSHAAPVRVEAPPQDSTSPHDNSDDDERHIRFDEDYGIV